jgi:hypothetical protein
MFYSRSFTGTTDEPCSSRINVDSGISVALCAVTITIADKSRYAAMSTQL